MCTLVMWHNLTNISQLELQLIIIIMKVYVLINHLIDFVHKSSENSKPNTPYNLFKLFLLSNQ